MAIKKEYCPNCFQIIGEGATRCPYCGLRDFERTNLLALPVNALIHDRYIMGRVLGAGGFGITYKSYDTKTDKICAIKEYVPLDNATRNKDDFSLSATNSSRKEIFDYGKKKFLLEAETLRKLKNISDVVKIMDCFSENGTAYFVMEYLDGSSLNGVRRSAGGRLPFEMAAKIILEAAACLEEIHTRGNIFHRDISPENIMITKNGKVKVIDFGTAKYIHGKKSQNLSVVLKPGYAPPEQYTSKGKQGSYTDVYALAATFYYILTGTKIPPAPDRLDPSDEKGSLVPLENYPFLGKPYEKLTVVLEKALMTNASKRTQTMRQFSEELKEYVLYWEKHVKSEPGKTVTNDDDVFSGKEDKPRSVPEPYLLGLTRPVKGYRYPLPVNTIVTVGRSSQSNIIVPLNVIGRKHVEIFFDTYTNLFYITDNHSVNKTVLNGTPCEPEKIYPAKPGSWIALARNSCVFQLRIKENEYGK